MNKLGRTAALLCGASFFIVGSPAFAQTAGVSGSSGEQAAEPAPEQATTDEIVVTGSRAIRNGNTMPSPVTVVQPNEMLKVQPGTIADALNSLPVFAGSRGRTSNPTSTGSAGAGNGSANQLNLRNIGANRTLVLMDGLRVPPTLLNGVVDVDIVPQLLVQRVDTVTGGVSAVYGSDAVTGVVNYILDKKFTGVRAQASAGISERGDAAQRDVGVAAGADLFGGRGHVIASYEYRKEDGVTARSRRDWLDLRGVTGAGTAANPYVLNSNVRQAGAPFGGLITSGVLAGQTFATNGVLRPFVPGQATGTAGLEIGGDGGYYDSSLVSPLEFHQLFGRFDFEASDALRFHAQVAGDIKTNSNASDFPRLTNVTLSATNAFLAPAYQAQLQAAGQSNFRFSELVSEAPRLEPVSDTRQWVVNTGVAGSLGKFDWTVDYTYGATTLKTTLNGNLNNQRLAAALDAVVDPRSGNVVCNITLTNPGLAPGCVPLNLFGPSAASAEALDYVLQPTHYRAETRMNDVAASISGSPVSTWAGPVGLALSGEYRDLSFRAVSDGEPTALVDCTGIRFNCTTGGALWANSFASSPKVSQSVWEAAFEADIPLLRDVPFVTALNLNGAVRYTSYNTSGDYWTWKIGLDWHITDRLRVRGTRSRDIRAPTLYELFAPTNSVPVNPTDLLTGLSPRVPSTDLSNPDLTAEIGNTFTAGIVWNPTSRLSLAVDGYHITVSDAVTQIAGSTPSYQQSCYASGGTSEFCALQDRPINYTDKSAANAVTRWYTLFMNIAEVETWGIDLEANYSTTLFDRPASLRILGAYQPHVYYRQPGTPTTDQGGVAFGPLGLSAGPSVRITAFARFQPVEHVTLDIMERWRNAMKLGGDPTQVWASNHIDAFGTTNLTLTFDTKGVFGDAEFYVNVTNLFDADPPGGAYSGNGTRTGLRDGFALGDDPIGRAFLAGVRLKF